MTTDTTSSKKYNKWIVLLSIIIPLVVGLMFNVRLDIELPVFLPPIYAGINAIAALLLLIAVWAIKNKKEKLHERLMKITIMLSVVFLLLYLAHHMTSDSTKFGGEGTIRYIYIFILLTHILLSIAVIPFVLITYVRAITSDFERHKKIARFTFPLWLYVAVSGVIVYVMISPYY